MRDWIKVVTVVYYAANGDRMRREVALANGKTLMSFLEELSADHAEVIYVKVKLVAVFC